MGEETFGAGTGVGTATEPEGGAIRTTVAMTGATVGAAATGAGCGTGAAVSGVLVTRDAARGSAASEAPRLIISQSR